MQRVRYIGVFEVADWVWSWRWLALTMMILAIIGTFFMLQPGKALAPAQDDLGYEVTLQIYAAGTPVRSLAEIANILGTQLLNDDVVLTSPWATVPVVLHTHTREEADRTVARAEEISDQLTAEVQVQAEALEKFLNYRPVPDLAMSQYIRAQAFAHGIEEGLIDVVRGSVALAATPSRSKPALIPSIFAILAFFLIAGGTTFIREWRRHSSSRVTH